MNLLESLNFSLNNPVEYITFAGALLVLWATAMAWTVQNNYRGSSSK